MLNTSDEQNGKQIFVCVHYLDFCARSECACARSLARSLAIMKITRDRAAVKLILRNLIVDTQNAAN